MRNRITFEKLGDYLYDVKIDGKKSRLSVYFEAGRFLCYDRQFGELSARTLEEIRNQIENEID
ncbi:MAG: hypothetical protein IKY09_02630 [Methanocorpusculum sp.]|nr:hypothetical protein [Methanocorpusculum sp.]MBR5451032.1 hypothetical protein [Methanocorpusculum sp.]